MKRFISLLTLSILISVSIAYGESPRKPAATAVATTAKAAPNGQSSQPALPKQQNLKKTNQLVVEMKPISGKAKGYVFIAETPFGLLFTPHMKGLKPGPHGFHLHKNPNCQSAGTLAGGHYDPDETGLHLGPYRNDGHLGDLPVLLVNQDGTATVPLLAPRLALPDVMGHSLIIHEGSDNYSDFPNKLGGGGKFIACGVVSQGPSLQ